MPDSVCWSVRLWLTAVAAGVLEALIYVLTSPGYDVAVQLPVRVVIYLLVTALILRLRRGQGWVRMALAILLGGFGLLSLLVEPVSWWMAGGSPAAFLADADTATLAVVAVRVVHVASVLVALTLMYRPTANRFFRRSPSKESVA
ncbi:hypothetical protein M1247_20995 [Mycobacterium sp. 21AC1]|uniref:hypothetical protein n=1 Tax=[Mycobacterium] appelbergii TaxID=2939269 RepID=UPI002938E15A|nr:hypothetical protein [Mycobacterium sp. 21AC1]MDV3127415.1 hypothetical protein [Mycobacterium sp. 21AC1]